jgi:predicted unusual protein kinase regulating ubiquinone biosynthesis (AarF/ABC1/UbiB family)
MQQNKQILIDAVVHAVNEDYAEMANDFTRLGFLASGTDVSPIIPALEAIWQNSAGKGLADFNFRSVTGNVDSLNVLLYLFSVSVSCTYMLLGSYATVMQKAGTFSFHYLQKILHVSWIVSSRSYES